MFDYEFMRLIWWALLGILLIGFAVMDGFDLGVAILLPYVARTDVERRIAINTIGPVWEGNQVWLILGGGAIFAAWPMLYATAFSGFYLAMFLVLAALILRPVAFKFRSKLDHARWRAIWDAAIFVSGLIPALIFGVAFGNVIVGVPFRFDDALRMNYEGGLVGLLNPFALSQRHHQRRDVDAAWSKLPCAQGQRSGSRSGRAGRTPRRTRDGRAVYPRGRLGRFRHRRLCHYLAIGP